MPSTVAEEFTGALSDLDVGWTRTAADAFGTVLADVTEPPTVGAPLPQEDVSLEAIAVDIDLDPSLSALRDARTGVTGAALGIADYGSVILRTDDPGTEVASLFVDRHVAVIAEHDVQPDMTTALAELAPLFRDEQASAVLATGPSATADMGELVRGAHGPKEVHVVILEGR